MQLTAEAVYLCWWEDVYNLEQKQMTIL